MNTIEELGREYWDSRKTAIALAQTYFAIQTRKQELSEKNIEV